MTLKEYFEKGFTPKQYEELLGEQLKLHQLHYRRAEISDEAVTALRGLKPRWLLVITEPWCGDSLAVLPVLLKLFDQVGSSEIRIVLRDQNLELMDRYLTRGGRAIPIVIFLDEACEELFHWGPRPVAAQVIFEEQREGIKAGRIDKTEVIKQIRNFYGRDRGRSIIEELCRKLSQHAE